MKTTEKFWKH